MTDAATITRPQYRSSEELEMRALVVPELRKRYPTARIIHELPLRYSSRRIDLAAVTEDAIVAVEIKSSKDVIDRLEAQLRAFNPICRSMYVALAPKWNEQLPMLETKRGNGGTYSYQYTEAQQIIQDVGSSAIGIWTVDAASGTLTETQACYRGKLWRPWLSKMLDILHVAELTEIAARHRCWSGKRPNHGNLSMACADLMTGPEITRAVCAALRARKAFGADSDPPVI